MRKNLKKFCFSFVIACICFAFSMLLQSHYNVEFTKRVQIAIAMACAMLTFYSSTWNIYVYYYKKKEQ